jgi:sporulation protein YlmC with PRC-barrel domain
MKVPRPKTFFRPWNFAETLLLTSRQVPGDIDCAMSGQACRTRRNLERVTAHAQRTTTGAATPVQSQVPDTLPAHSTTVTNYYKQNVYDPSDVKIGEITDVLLGKDGKVEAFIISVGGFLGLGEKDVAVPFTAVHGTEKNGMWYLTMNSTKDALKAAHGRRRCKCLPQYS